MENYAITISKAKETHHFEVGEYPHHDEKHCRFKVFENGVYVAGFEPDAHQFLHVCQNPGKVHEEILHLLAAKVEAHYPQPPTDNFQKHIL